MECGQYNEMWKEIHMMPEETAQAGIDVKAKFIMPIHWGAFKLAMHSWTDPVERVTKKALELNLRVLVPRIGEPIHFEKQANQTTNWWSDFNCKQTLPYSEIMCFCLFYTFRKAK